MVMSGGLIGYEFDTEDGRARVIADDPEGQYVTVLVYPDTGEVQRSTRLRALVQANKTASQAANFPRAAHPGQLQIGRDA